MIYNFFDKRTSGRGIANENISNQRPLDLATRELAEELYKRIIRKFKKKSTLTFYGQYLGANLVHMQLISKLSKGIPFLLCAIDIFSKYALVIPLKDKKRY